MLSVDEAAARGDLDELVRHVDRLCSSREWDELIRLRDKAKAAHDREAKGSDHLAAKDSRVADEARVPVDAREDKTAGAVVLALRKRLSSQARNPRR